MCVEPFCEEEGGGGEEAVEGSGRGWAEEVCFVWVGHGESGDFDF